jgi:recombinational DNA repair protein RecR
LEGDATGHYIRDQIKARFGDKVNVTRTALGLPAGSSVEYTDPSTLENALAHRTAIE